MCIYINIKTVYITRNSAQRSVLAQHVLAEVRQHECTYLCEIGELRNCYFQFLHGNGVYWGCGVLEPLVACHTTKLHIVKHQAGFSGSPSMHGALPSDAVGPCLDSQGKNERKV